MNLLIMSLNRAEEINIATKHICKTSAKTYGIIFLICVLILIFFKFIELGINRTSIPLWHKIDNVLSAISLGFLFLAITPICSTTINDNKIRLNNIKTYVQMKNIKRNHPSIIHYKIVSHTQYQLVQKYHSDKKYLHYYAHYGFKPQRPQWWDYL